MLQTICQFVDINQQTCSCTRETASRKLQSSDVLPGAWLAAAATVVLPNMALSVRQHSRMQGGTDAVDSMSAPVSHPQQLFQELKQYSRLLARPKIAASLQAEQAALAKQVWALCGKTAGPECICSTDYRRMRMRERKNVLATVFLQHISKA